MHAALFQQRLRDDLRTAMRERDTAATKVIRRLLSAVANGEAVPAPKTDALGFAEGPSEAPRRVLTETEVAAIVSGEIDAHRTALADYRALGVATAELEAELTVLERYSAA